MDEKCMVELFRCQAHYKLEKEKGNVHCEDIFWNMSLRFFYAKSENA